MREAHLRRMPLGLATLSMLFVSACGPDPADLVLFGGAVITLSEAGTVEGIGGSPALHAGGGEFVGDERLGPGRRRLRWAPS